LAAPLKHAAQRVDDFRLYVGALHGGSQNVNAAHKQKSPASCEAGLSV
jgi:hypothetical protein